MYLTIYPSIYMYRRTAAFLEKDSGILLQAPEVSEFCKSVMEGQWGVVESLLPSLQIKRDSDIAVLSYFFIYFYFLLFI